MKQAINTRTQEEYDALMRYYESKGVKWNGGVSSSKYNAWHTHKNSTCVLLNYYGQNELTAGSLDHVKKIRGYTIIPYTEFAKVSIVDKDLDSFIDKHYNLIDCTADNKVRKKLKVVLTEFAKTIKPEIDYRAKYEEAVMLLERIAEWQLPETGKFWDEERTQPTSYEAEYGSNGVRDYWKNEAQQFLTNHKDGE